MTDAAVPTPRTGAAPEPAFPVDHGAPGTVLVTTPDLPDLGAPTPTTPADRDLRLLADVPVQVAAELARLTLPLQTLLELERGSVVELDRDVDAPVDLLVNGLLVARGEVVVVDGRLAVRVLEIVER